MNYADEGLAVLLGFLGPDFLFRVIAVVVGLVIHEYAHAVCADALGDKTPRMYGRLTLNPLVHFEPLGLLMMLFAPIGWAKPVPINAYNFRHPRTGLVLTAFAGPASNLLLAVLSLFVVWLLHPGDANSFWIQLLSVIFAVNVNLFVFNLIPIPPLDGSRIVAGLLPPRQALAFRRLEPYGPFILLLAFLIPQVQWMVFSPLFLSVQRWIASWFGWMPS